MIELTNFNKKKWTRSNLLPNKDGSKPQSKAALEEFEQNMELLDWCKRCYESLEYVRTEEETNERYVNGDQLSDLMTDPETGKQITEYEYICRQGKRPISINMMVKMLTPVLGRFSSKQLEPTVFMRDETKKRSGRVLSALMKTMYERLFVRNIDVDGLKNANISGLVAFRTFYKYDSFRQTADVKTELLDNRRLFFDDNTGGLYFENIRTVGYIHDWNIGDVLKNFAKSKDQGDRIVSLYKDCSQFYNTLGQQYDPKEKKRTLSFYTPDKPGKCRVFEVWTKEGLYTCRCHDIKTGDDYFIDIEDKPLVEEENARRIAEATALGISEDEVPIIDTSEPYGDHYDEVWVVRFLTPNGYVLKKEVSPYEHGEHPFTIGARMLSSGVITCPMTIARPFQRQYNAHIQRIEYSRESAAKSMVIFDAKQLRDSHVTLEEASAAWSKPGSALALERGEEYKDPLPLSSDGVAASDIQMLQVWANMFSDATGLHGSYRGEEAKSGTPSSLYLQESQNAENNIAEMLDWYKGLVLLRNMKALKVMLQYYEDGRKVRIIGEDGTPTEAEYNYADIANLEYDVYMVESQDSGPAYIQNEEKLFALLQGGFISIKAYLSCSAASYAEKLKETIETEESAAQEKQQQMQQMQRAAMQQINPQMMQQ